jgi:hypothetical protein
MAYKPSTLSHFSDKQLLQKLLQFMPYFPFPQAEKNEGQRKLMEDQDGTFICSISLMFCTK